MVNMTRTHFESATVEDLTLDELVQVVCERAVQEGIEIDDLTVTLHDAYDSVADETDDDVL